MCSGNVMRLRELGNVLCTPRLYKILKTFPKVCYLLCSRKERIPRVRFPGCQTAEYKFAVATQKFSEICFAQTAHVKNQVLITTVKKQWDVLFGNAGIKINAIVANFFAGIVICVYRKNLRDFVSFVKF